MYCIHIRTCLQSIWDKATLIYVCIYMYVQLHVHVHVYMSCRMSLPSAHLRAETTVMSHVVLPQYLPLVGQEELAVRYAASSRRPSGRRRTDWGCPWTRQRCRLSLRNASWRKREWRSGDQSVSTAPASRCCAQPAVNMVIKSPCRCTLCVFMNKSTTQHPVIVLTTHQPIRNYINVTATLLTSSL